MTEFDQDPYLFNCKNGNIGPTHSGIRAHSPGDLLATISGVKYDPEATSELWERFIDDVTQGDKDTAIYLQKAMGYGLTGDTSEECSLHSMGPQPGTARGP